MLFNSTFFCNLVSLKKHSLRLVFLELLVLRNPALRQYFSRYLPFYMKRVLITILAIFSNFTFAQTEQISLDFFAKELLPKIKKVKVFYNGKVINKSDYEKTIKNEDDETIIENIIWEYSMCRKDSKKFNFDFKEITKNANVNNSTAKVLIIPKNIFYKKELVTKELKSGKLRYKLKKLFAQKYNIKVSPSIQIAEDTYLTRIFMTKQDYAHGNNFDIIVKNGKVLDWCNSYWIQ